jgi:hypothetical protein
LQRISWLRNSPAEQAHESLELVNLVTVDRQLILLQAMAHTSSRNKCALIRKSSKRGQPKLG